MPILGEWSYIDNHCHLSDERVMPHADALIHAAFHAKVKRLCLAGVEPDEWKRQLELKSRFPDLVLNFGLHPWWIEKFSSIEIEEILHGLDQQVLQANGLGETGLDFYSKRDPSRFDDQREAFRHQIRIAKRHSKPIVLHVVQAHEECVKILKEEHAAQVPLVIHSYSGNVTQLQEYIRLGAFISFSGTLVKAARGEGHEKIAKALLQTPVDHLLFETDSPDQGWAEGENTPAKVIEVYQAAAGLLEVDVDVLAARVEKNFNRVYSF